MLIMEVLDVACSFKRMGKISRKNSPFQLGLKSEVKENEVPQENEVKENEVPDENEVEAPTIPPEGAFSVEVVQK